MGKRGNFKKRKGEWRKDVPPFQGYDFCRSLPRRSPAAWLTPLPPGSRGALTGYDSIVVCRAAPQQLG